MSVEAMKQALEALEELKCDTFHPAKVFKHNPTIIALRQAIAEAEDAVAAERAFCAAICDEKQEVFQKYYTKGLAAMCAEAIRARGE